MKEGRQKVIYFIIHFYNILEKTKGQRQKSDQWLPKTETGD